MSLFKSSGPSFILAPMADITHIAFIELIRIFGPCDIFFTEMLNTRIVPNESLRKSSFLKFSIKAKPIICQLLGNEPLLFKKSMEKLEFFDFDGYNINMGCCEAELIKKGFGVALMKDAVQTATLVSRIRKYTKKNLSIKIRIGFEKNFNDLEQFCRLLENEGIDAIILHARTKADRYKRPAAWEYINKLKEIIAIPLIGNGDIRNPAEALEKAKTSKCEGIMIGRYAITNPIIFKQISQAASGQEITLLTNKLKKDIYLKLIDLIQEHFNTDIQLKKIKRINPFFFNSFTFGHSMLKKVNKANDLEELKSIFLDLNI
ncbi:MAG: tRNA-dihydrouridine synthase family protein [Pseudomonadota bacterium]